MRPLLPHMNGEWNFSIRSNEVPGSPLNVAEFARIQAPDRGDLFF